MTYEEYTEIGVFAGNPGWLARNLFPWYVRAITGLYHDYQDLDQRFTRQVEIAMKATEAALNLQEELREARGQAERLARELDEAKDTHNSTELRRLDLADEVDVRREMTEDYAGRIEELEEDLAHAQDEAARFQSLADQRKDAFDALAATAWCVRNELADTIDKLIEEHHIGSQAGEG